MRMRTIRSIQNVGRVVRDPVTIQEVEVFARVCLFPVMGLLVPDIIAEGLVIKSGDRECTIPMLPFEVLSVRKGLMNPAGGVRLDRGDQLGDGHGARWLEVQVDVVPDAAGAEQLPSLPRNY